MTEPNLRVRISADLADIKQGLGLLRGDLAKLKTDAARAVPDAGQWSRGIAGARHEVVKLAGAFLSLRAVGAVIRGIIENTRESEEAMAQLRAGIKSTGGIAGVTADEIALYASALQKTTTFSDDAIVRMSAVVATFTNIRGAVFKDAIPAILDLSVRLGTDLNSAAIQVGKALNDPVKGITALGRAGVQFSTQQKEVIADLVETGDVAKAQRIILAELTTQMGGSAPAAADTLSGALQQARNAFGDLLEGDSSRGGLKDAKVALQELARTLNSAEVKAGFASIVNGLGNLINFAARAVGAVNGIRVAIIDALAKDSQKTYLGLLAKYSALQDDLASLEGGPLQRARLVAGGRSGEVDPLKGPAENAEKLRAKLQDINVLLAKMRAQQSAKTAPEGAAASDNPTGAASSFDPGKVGKGSDEARRKAEALRKEMERLEAQSKLAMERLQQEEIKREEALQDQLDAADIELLRATGRNAEASFKEIEARYGELLDRLRKNSNVAGVAIVEQLIDIKKVQARLEEFRTKMQEITGALQAGQTSLGAQAAGGLIRDNEAEEKVATLRAKSLQQLQDLRTAVQAYYESTKDPAVLAFLQELTGNIGDVAASQDRLQQQAKDIAVDSLTNFLTDLATGAKSAKDAFRDFVSSFVRGIAQMIAQQLALMAVKTAMRAMGFAVMHGGGVAGEGGSIRQANPMLLGFAPRYHGGGIAGLGPKEVPAILERGEEVLTRNDPRHIRNGGGQDRTIVKTPVVAIGDRAVADALAGAAGEQVILTHVRNNWEGLVRYAGS
ncbi:hypothetical protein [Lysobacter sp. CFH 32150]|uniref:hypothetical protein n=1 Tax=Lysobacter sp. CFH 32150 TaxID=2927128 RepID=UPI001FA7F0F8|nr:hypothetical protein [Lysobacter sp. CFH 32150]MCI4566381.1 hypothetical protein [Lysobacter sp. CFH 32150]